MKKNTFAFLIGLFLSITGLNAQTFYGMTSGISDTAAQGGGTIFSYSVSGVYKTLVYFDSAKTGENPQGNLTLGAHGYLYGMTYQGGSSGLGTIFKCNVFGNVTVLVNFNGANGANPFGSLVMAADSNFYGMTYQGGSFGFGTIFKLTPSGTFSVLVNLDSINTGSWPVGNLIQATDGNLYGMTSYGGSFDYGTIFKCSTTGAFTTLYSFNGTNGANPEGSLLQAADGNFYGLTFLGGPKNFGTMFKCTPAGIYTPLVMLDSATQGVYPDNSLIQAANGTMYGETDYGGPTQYGTLFKYSTSGTFTVLHAFTGPEGAEPFNGIILVNDSILYGMTFSGGALNDGVLFKCDTIGNLTTLLDFGNYKGQGGTPYGLLTPVNVVTDSIAASATCSYVTLTGLAAGGTPPYTYEWSTGATTSSINVAGDATYSVVVRDVNGISDTASYMVSASFSPGFDLTGNLSICVDTPSFTNASIQACVYNNRCLPTNGNVKMVLDTAFHITSVIADSAAHIIGDTLMWNFDSLSDTGNTFCVTLNGTVDTLPANDSVFVYMLITPFTGDSVPGNNFMWQSIKTNAPNCAGLPFDPNGKTVTPQGGIGTFDKLTYTIHFQNTGTAPAHTVVVVDTISPHLDISTLKVLSCSSAETTTITGGNVVKFTFSNINLPDTAASKTASIGNIQYSIYPSATDKPFDNIYNTAYIYFDSNPAVATGTTFNDINQVLGVNNIHEPAFNLACFPNPFSNITSIVFSTSGKHYVEVDDITGRKLESMECSGAQYELNRNGLAAGVYFIKAWDEGQKYVATTKVIVQ